MKHTLLGIFLFSLFYTHAQDSEYEKQIAVLTEKGYSFYGTKKDSGQFYFEKIERLALAKGDSLTALDILITSNRHLADFFDLQHIKKNLLKIDTLVNSHTSFLDNLDDPLLYQNSINYDKGNYYFKIGDLQKAKTLFNTIKDSYRNRNIQTLGRDHFDLLSVSYSFLAKIYELEDKPQLAKDYYLSNIQLIKEVTPDDLDKLNINRALLAEVLREEGDITSANSYLELALRDALAKKDNPNRIVSVANNLADNHLALGHTEEALQYISIVESYLDKSPHFKHLYHRTKAKMAQREQRMDAALLEMDLALESYLGQSQRINNSSLANILKEKAQLAALSNQYRQALGLVNSALDTLQSDSNPIFLELMGLKVQYLNHLEDYAEAHNVGLMAVSSLDSLKADYHYSSDKIHLMENTFPLFESALQANFALHEETGDPKYLENAFFFMEKSKSVLLLEAIRASRASKFAKVPDSLVEKERLLKTEITSLEKELAINSNGKGEMTPAIFERKEQQSQLISLLSKNYPAYYTMRYGNTVVQPDHILRGLARDQMLVSYFFGDHAIYAISLGHTARKFVKIEHTKELTELLLNFYEQLSSPTSNLAEIKPLATKIQEKIVAPVLLPKVKKLIVIPDGNLHYIPFAALTSPKDTKKYLIEDYTVSYANSATLLAQLLAGAVDNEKLLAFAPSFHGQEVNASASRDKLSPLPHNTTETAHVIKLFNGDVFEGEKASLQNFNRYVPQYGLLHLATHAVFNNTQPEYSYLAFAHGSQEQLLFVKDLYNLDLNMDMVTLSACETALGDLKRGEGFIGLASGFFYAGAKSITSTLWKVNDASTASLMGNFYETLSKGHTKDVALQEAQKLFLKRNRDNALVHPYYWSGFVLSGNHAPLDPKWPWLWIMAPLLLLLVLILIFGTGKKASSTP